MYIPMCLILSAELNMFILIALVLIGLLLGIVLLHRWRVSQLDQDPTMKFKTEFKQDSLDALGLSSARPKTSSTIEASPKATPDDKARIPAEPLTIQDPVVPVRSVSKPSPIEEPLTLKPDKEPSTRNLSGNIGEGIVSIRPLPPKPKNIPVKIEAPIEAVPDAPVEDQKSKAPDEPLTIPIPDKSEQKGFDALLAPLIQSAKTALQAHTVCVVQVQDESHRVIAICSDLPVFKRHIPQKQSFLTQIPSSEALMVLMPDEIKKEVFYYDEPVELSMVVVASLKNEQQLWGYLIADATDRVRLTNPNLLLDFRNLLESVIKAQNPPQVEPETLQLQTQENPLRSRREIISEEMRRARTAQVPMSFSLVYLNEQIQEGELSAKQSMAYEGQLWDFLHESVKDHGRVERFNELLLGVFYFADTEGTATWLNDLQENIAKALSIPERSVSVGAVMMHDHHRDAETLRADALRALEQVHQSGGAVLIE
jgi:hypothetical protein